jgi:hypothetical protein
MINKRENIMADGAAKFSTDEMMTLVTKFRDLWNTTFPENKIVAVIGVDVGGMPCVGLQRKEEDFMSIWFDIVGFDGLGFDNKNRVWEMRCRPEYRQLIVDAKDIHDQIVNF